MPYVLGQLLECGSAQKRHSAAVAGGRIASSRGQGWRGHKMTHGPSKENKGPARDCLWWLAVHGSELQVWMGTLECLNGRDVLGGGGNHLQELGYQQ